MLSYGIACCNKRLLVILMKCQESLQVLAIEFVTFAVEFILLANEFVTLAIEFVPLTIKFVTLAQKFILTE